MLKQCWIVGAVVALSVVPLAAQEADWGVSVPVTLSGGFLDSQRLQLSDPNASAANGGFRAMIYPTLKLGSHWFAYAAIQVRRVPYFYYDAFFSDHNVETDVIQAYVGYAVRKGPASMVFKAGRLTTAFGSFPLRYDDTENPLLDQPLSYITEVPLRQDQVLCGTSDLLQQYYGSVGASCGGAPGRGPGLTPVSLYGLPGVQAEVSARGFDGRLQLTSNSPADLPDWRVARQFVQWAAGGGYTIHQGFRVGMSAFRGPYLDRVAAAALPTGTSVRDFPANGTGVDAQWAGGRFSVQGEWQDFRFHSPNFVVAPSVRSGYGEVKSVITPRFYLAARAGGLNVGRVVDQQGVAAQQFAPTLTSVELGAGGWINRHSLVKASYSFLRIEGASGRTFDVVGFQFVTSFHALERAFR